MIKLKMIICLLLHIHISYFYICNPTAFKKNCHNVVQTISYVRRHHGSTIIPFLYYINRKKLIPSGIFSILIESRPTRMQSIFNQKYSIFAIILDSQLNMFQSFVSLDAFVENLGVDRRMKSQVF